MKIYIASSWKNKSLCYDVRNILISHDHRVDLFCFDHPDRFTFSLKDLSGWEQMDQFAFSQTREMQQAFQEDKKWLDWSDVCLLLLPCGKSAHLEAGYAKGSNKYVIIMSDFPIGELDVMYGFADAIIKTGDWNNLIDVLKELSKT